MVIPVFYGVKKREEEEDAPAETEREREDARSRIPAIINRFFARGRAKAPSVRFPRALPSPTSPSR